MKKTLFLAMIPIVLLVGSAIFFWTGKEAKAVTVQISIKDFPIHGLELIGPSDPAFKDKISTLLKDKKNPVVDTLKPYSVFLKNTGNKAIVGYWLKWEMIKLDGTVVSREAGGINPDALMDGDITDLGHLSLTTGYAIKPNSTRFVSLAFSLGEEEVGGTIGAYASGTANEAEVEQFQQAAKNRNPSSMADKLVTELQSYSNITVSVDGVFFQDGTFVGTDNTIFFAQVQAHIDAKRDLLEEISFATKRKRSSQEIFSDIEEIANNQYAIIRQNPTTSDYYNYYKKMYAEEILHMRNAMDSKKAISISLQALHKKWQKLKKL